MIPLSVLHEELEEKRERWNEEADEGLEAFSLLSFVARNE